MEGFARETLAFEDPVNPEITCNHIRQVRKNDIVKMANQLLSNNPAIAILGESNETSKLYDDACKAQLNSRPLLVRTHLTDLKCLTHFDSYFDSFFRELDRYSSQVQKVL